MATTRIKHISHNDLDGYSATVLTELIVDKYPKGMFSLEVVNILPNKLIEEVNETLMNINNFDLIIITDLAVKQELVDIIENSGHKEKFRVFDHHETDVNCENYKWLTVKIEKPDKKGNMKKTCGTELYYDFIRQDTVFDIHILQLKTDQAISHFVEVVRSYDTYDFYNNLTSGEKFDLVAEDAPRLNTLFHAIDHSEFKLYIDRYIHEDKIDFMQLTVSTERYPWINKVIELEDRKNKRYVESAMKKLNVITLDKSIFKNEKVHELHYIVGLVFAEKNGPMIGKAACKNYPEIDFCAVLTNNQVSLYTSKSEVDVSSIARLLGGGGHKRVAGFTISYSDSNWLNKNHFNAMVNIAGNISPTIIK